MVSPAASRTGVIGLEVFVDSRDQVTALTGFGVHQRAPQFLQSFQDLMRA
ncbi:MAG: hypothetical protein NVV63_17090 [Opitutus sp.]|nr:hypothetical protein [Opitutus sp.]